MSSFTEEDLADLKQRLAAAGQGHIFDSLPELKADSNIVRQLTVECRSWEETLKNYAKAKAATPIPVDKVRCIDHVTKWGSLTSERRDEVWNVGVDAIRRGTVAAAIMSGGQGTRLGFSGPKGMYDVGMPSKHSIFSLHFEKLRGVRRLCQSDEQRSRGVLPSIPVYIMTSSLNDAEIKEYFAANSYFGYPTEDIFFFAQRLEPCLTYDGRIIIESPTSLSMAPDGNGGLYHALEAGGGLKDMEERGVAHLHIYGVDNVLTKAVDPAFIGCCVDGGVECGNKVVWRANAAEKVGVTVEVDGRMCVVEYSDITKEMADATDGSGSLIYGAANICNHYMSVRFIKEKVLTQLYDIYHLANKKIPYMDPATRQTVTPPASNGVKMEMFIFDVFPLANAITPVASTSSSSTGDGSGTRGGWLVMEVLREDEFAPVKNEPGNPVDSPDTARSLISRQAMRWLTAAGATVVNALGEVVASPGTSGSSDSGSSGILPPDRLCEISPLVSYQGEGLEARFSGKTVTLPCYIE